jgi:hypothetical protein
LNEQLGDSSFSLYKQHSTEDTAACGDNKQRVYFDVQQQYTAAAAAAAAMDFL